MIIQSCYHFLFYLFSTPRINYFVPFWKFSFQNIHRRLQKTSPSIHLQSLHSLSCWSTNNLSAILFAASLSAFINSLLHITQDNWLQWTSVTVIASIADILMSEIITGKLQSIEAITFLRVTLIVSNTA
jgi:hypothetical protein